MCAAGKKKFFLECVTVFSFKLYIKSTNHVVEIIRERTFSLFLFLSCEKKKEKEDKKLFWLVYACKMSSKEAMNNKNLNNNSDGKVKWIIKWRMGNLCGKSDDGTKKTTSSCDKDKVPSKAPLKRNCCDVCELFFFWFDSHFLSSFFCVFSHTHTHNKLIREGMKEKLNTIKLTHSWNLLFNLLLIMNL